LIFSFYFKTLTCLPEHPGGHLPDPTFGKTAFPELKSISNGKKSLPSETNISQKQAHP
jgi:hypothetical protein